jgi:hypothetical protein
MRSVLGWLCGTEDEERLNEAEPEWNRTPPGAQPTLNDRPKKRPASMTCASFMCVMEPLPSGS